MNTISKIDYPQNPCRVSSIPYWKAKTISVPEGIRILHCDDFEGTNCEQFQGEPFFRLLHDLRSIPAPKLPDGFSLQNAAPKEYAEHICQCYADIGVSEEELQSYTQRPVYAPALWLAVRDDHTDQMVATGIGELDREIGEGILEWIQVSKAYRGRGLGRYVVSKLLRRMKEQGANFATVSGQCHNPSNPEKLYRKCGFAGADVWYILPREEPGR